MANPFAEKYCDDEELFPPVRSENDSSRIENQKKIETRQIVPVVHA